MCSQQEHSARPVYKSERDQVWQWTENGWVNITPGVDFGGNNEDS